MPGAPQTTLNFIGAGVTVADAGGGVADITIADVNASPDRTLFVAQSWSGPVDPTRYFTSIAAAYVASAALNPTLANPVEILVYPGTYPDPITIVSNVHLVGTGQQRAVTVTGAVTWTPGAGVNAPQTNVEERLNVAFMTLAGPWLIDATAKTAGSANVVFRGVIFSATSSFVHNGRAPATDVFFIFASVQETGSTHTFTNVTAVLLGTRTATLTFNGTSTFLLSGGLSAGSVNVNQTGPGRITGQSVLGPVNVATGSQILIAGGVLLANVTVAAGGTADVRMTNVNGNAKLVGPGTINRTTWTGTFGPTVVGANLVVLNPPYPDALYNVHLQLVAGPGSAAVTVTGKTGAGFTINDPVGGNTFNYTVIHD